MEHFLLAQINELQTVSAEVNCHFGKLSVSQLNWKPAPGKWSIAQVLEHLIISNSTYFPQFTEIAKGRHRNSLWQRMSMISRFLGRQMINDLGPRKPRTFKNPAMFTPSESDLPATVVADFITQQVELENYLLSLAGTNLKSTIIYSPVTKLIIYSLHDAILIITGHEQRHLLQAKEVLEHPAFP